MYNFKQVAQFFATKCSLPAKISCKHKWFNFRYNFCNLGNFDSFPLINFLKWQKSYSAMVQ